MITIGKITNAIQRFFESTAKARLNSELLRMGRERVEAFGYSYEALRIGPGAWPRRKTTQDNAMETEIQARIRPLKGYTDRRPGEPGIAPCRIEQAMRHGRPGIDRDQNAA